jgi:uncharacterized integral membrane protein (TIGR00698 family)
MPAARTASYHPISAEALISLDSMEGVYRLPMVETRPAAAAPARRLQTWPGYALAAAVAAAAYGVHYLPFPPFEVSGPAGIRRPVSAAILAILGGIVARNLLPLPASVLESSKGLARTIIPITIVLTGAGLNLATLASAGAPSIAITVICILAATAAAIWFGRLLGLTGRTPVLLGAGTAICGTSAIVAVAPLVEAEDDEVMLSIGTVNVLGLLLMFLLPIAGAFLALDNQAFGVWAGTSIHAVPQVIAAGFAYSPAAGALATLVKLVRVAMLAPFMFLLGIWYARRRHSGQPKIHYARLVPPFVWGFLLLAILNTAGLLPVMQFRFGNLALSKFLAEAGELLLTLSMAAMGLEVNARLFAKVGGKALAAGTLASIALCAVSLLLIRLLL